VKRLVVIGVLVAVAYGARWAWRPDACGAQGAVPCPSPELANGLGREISRAEACRNSGYLCRDLGRSGTLQVRRRPLRRGTLRVRIPNPPGVSEERGRELKETVAEAVRRWDGHPFPVEIDMGPIRAGEAVRIADLPVSEGVELLEAPTAVVVRIVGKRAMQAEADAVLAEAEGPEAAEEEVAEEGAETPEKEGEEVASE